MKMKKAMVLLMALVLCMLCASAMAQETQTYTHPTQGYAITVPTNWLCVDKSNVQEYITAYEQGEIDFSGTNAQTLAALQVQLNTSDCAVLINPYANNIVIVKENMGITLTNEQFTSMMIPVLKQQLTAQMPSIQFTAEGETVAFGDKEFILLAAEYSMGGVTASVDMLFYLDGTNLYTLNLTTTAIFGQDVVNAFYADVQEACATFTITK